MGKLFSKPHHFYILFALLFVVFCFWVPDSGYDKYFWISWSKEIAENGLGNIYNNPEVNNFPIVLWILKLFTLYVSAENIDAFGINYLKCLVVVFDFLTLGIVAWLLNKNNKHPLLILILLLNPAFWYNTIIWGQVDTVYTCFVFISLLFTVEKKLFPALLFMLLAINTKLQAVIFLPFILLLFFNTERTEKTQSYAEFLRLIVIQFIILLPFIISGNFQQTIHSLVNSSVDFYPTVSRNAYNLWYFFFIDPLNTSDQLTFLLPLKFWGIILFVVFFVTIVFLFLKSGKTTENIFLVFALISLGFFFFNTQMHERYVHPVVLFSGLYAIFSKRYFLLIITSVAYLLNLEAVMQTFSYFDDEIFGFVMNYSSSFIFKPVLISCLFLSAIVIGIIDLRKSITTE